MSSGGNPPSSADGACGVPSIESALRSGPPTIVSLTDPPPMKGRVDWLTCQANVPLEGTTIVEFSESLSAWAGLVPPGQESWSGRSPTETSGETPIGQYSL